MNAHMGIAPEAHEDQITHQIAEDVTWAKNMAKQGVAWGPMWWVNPRDIQAPQLGLLPQRQKLRGARAGHLWALPPGADAWAEISPSPA